MFSDVVFDAEPCSGVLVFVSDMIDLMNIFLCLGIKISNENDVLFTFLEQKKISKYYNALFIPAIY